MDLAVETGGNVEGSEVDKEVEVNGVRIIGLGNLPGRVAVNASQMYSTNMCSFVETYWNEEEKKLKLDWDDEIIQGCVITHEGEIRNEMIKKLQKSVGVSNMLVMLLFVFVLAMFLGFELITKVPSQLHTPLMSGSNAISGITIVGALLAAGSVRERHAEHLSRHGRRRFRLHQRGWRLSGDGSNVGYVQGKRQREESPDMREPLINFAYIVASVLFIVGLKMLSSQKTAQKGNMFSAVGMLIAVVATLAQQGMEFPYIIAGAVVGGLIGAVAAARVPMTSMPEFVALFNGFGGIASLLVGWAEYHRQHTDWAGQSLTFRRSSRLVSGRSDIRHPIDRWCDVFR